MKSWNSSLLVNLLVGESLRLSDLSIDNGNLYWAESRPSEKGRSTIVCLEKSGKKTEFLPEEYSAKSSLHVYGGKAYSVSDGQICFINKHDQKIYLRDRNAQIIPLLGEDNVVYGGLQYYANENLLFGIREIEVAPHQQSSELFVYDLGSSQLHVLHREYDFYANVTYHPESKQVAFLAWNHPHMPWDQNFLSTANYQDGQLKNVQTVSPLQDVSIFQPTWHPNGDLLYVSNKSGWSNLYAMRNGQHRCLYETKIDFSLPLWVTGMSTYGVDQAGNLWAAGKENGEWKLFHLDGHSASASTIPLKSKSLLSIAVGGSEVAFIGASSSQLASIQRYHTINKQTEIIQKSSPFTVPTEYLPDVQSIYFPSYDGTPVQAWYYPATNPQFSHAAGEAPLIVIAHSGPTAAADCELDPRYLFWTSRGYSILDVNYRGSTGFGKSYQDDLRGQWGLIDRLDCEAAAQYAVEQGWANPEKLLIRGSSAGGLTVLSCLTFGNTFAAGASYYGVSDLIALAAETHRFEAHYSDHLVGPLPESTELYKERSPAYHSDKLTKPVAFFQGTDDVVVPPSQSKIIYNALRKKNIPTLYQEFAGEGHGFRQLKTIKSCLEQELAFYESVL